MDLDFFAPTARGTAQVAAAELGALGLRDVRAQAGGVAFRGDLAAGYRAILGARVPTRVLLRLARFTAERPEDIYEGARAVPWHEHLDPGRTFAVHAVAPQDAWANRTLLTLRVKDALVDSLRDRTGARPSVDKERPDVRVHAHLGPAERGGPATRVTVSLDLAGEPLHRRGLDRAGAYAPLKETLAAALLYLMDWPARAARGEPFVDPLCGSGTLLVEAAWMALGVAPGLLRRRFGVHGWRGHDPALWERVRRELGEARPLVERADLRVVGYDRAEAALSAARANARRAGVSDVVTLERRELRDAGPPVGAGPGLVLTNPPYGVRLGDEGALAPLYEALGDVLRRGFLGYRAGVFTGSPALARAVGLRAEAKHALYNGPIECRLLDIPISAEPVREGGGPGWRRPSKQAEMFANRLRKDARRWGKWARRRGVECYRVYDREIPEYNVAVDRYGDAVVVSEYRRPRRVPEHEAVRRLRDVTLVTPEVLGVDPEAVHVKVRVRAGQRQAARGQYEKVGDGGARLEVREGPWRFLVNPSDYLDTGLFLDQRAVRRRLARLAAGKRLLNLYAYTATASVAAARGLPAGDGAASGEVEGSGGAAGARQTTSVDLSRTYLLWGLENFRANGLRAEVVEPGARWRADHVLVRSDVRAWLDAASAPGGPRYDVIYVAPPARSVSRRAPPFDLVEDHPALLRAAFRLLASGGVVLFSSPIAGLELALAAGAGVEDEDWTAALTPEDFRRGPQPFRCWALRRAAEVGGFGGA